MLIYKAFGWVQPIQNLTFSDLNLIKNSYFFWCLILDLIFRHFGASSYQNGRFWDPLGAQLGTKWRPKSPKWCQNASQFCFPRSPFSWPTSKVLSGAVLGTISSDFWWILTPFSRIFLIFNQILGINLGHCFARRPELACWFIAKFQQRRTCKI